MGGNPKSPARKKSRATFRTGPASYIAPELRGKLRELPIMSRQREIDRIGRFTESQQPLIVDQLVAGAPTVTEATEALRAQAATGEVPCSELVAGFLIAKQAMSDLKHAAKNGVPHTEADLRELAKLPRRDQYTVAKMIKEGKAGVSEAIAMIPSEARLRLDVIRRDLELQPRGGVDKAVLVQTMTTEDGRTVEHLQIRYGWYDGQNHDLWRINVLPQPLELTKTLAVRITVKSTSPLHPYIYFKVAGSPEYGGDYIGGPWTKGTGAWETIEMPYTGTRELMNRALASGVLPQSAKDSPMVIDGMKTLSSL